MQTKEERKFHWNNTSPVTKKKKKTASGKKKPIGPKKPTGKRGPRSKCDASRNSED